MAAGADSIAATSTAVPASPAGPGSGGTLPGPVVISGQQIPGPEHRQPRGRLRWAVDTGRFGPPPTGGKALRLGRAGSVFPCPAETPRRPTHDELPRPDRRERG